jgi:hypothetical protein
MRKHFSSVTPAVAILLFLSACSVPQPPPPASGCGTDDPRVGQTAELENTFVHHVQGTARIVDDCTIVISGFYYDGKGIDVRIAGIRNGDFQDYVVLSQENLVRQDPYVNETLTVTLPEGVTLDDVPEISVFCVPFRLSFADGTFQ